MENQICFQYRLILFPGTEKNPFDKMFCVTSMGRGDAKHRQEKEIWRTEKEKKKTYGELNVATLKASPWI